MSTELRFQRIGTRHARYLTLQILLPLCTLSKLTGLWELIGTYLIVGGVGNVSEAASTTWNSLVITSVCCNSVDVVFRH